MQIFDSWAGELSPASFKEVALPYITYICDHLPKRLEGLGEEKVPMVIFAKGAWYALEDLCKTKYDVVGLDWLHAPKDAYKVAQKYVLDYSPDFTDGLGHRMMVTTAWHEEIQALARRIQFTMRHHQIRDGKSPAHAMCAKQRRRLAPVTFPALGVLDTRLLVHINQPTTEVRLYRLVPLCR